MGSPAPTGERGDPAGEFFTGAMTTDLGPAEVLTEVRFPVAAAGGRASASPRWPAGTATSRWPAWRCGCDGDRGSVPGDRVRGLRPAGAPAISALDATALTASPTCVGRG